VVGRAAAGREDPIAHFHEPSRAVVAGDLRPGCDCVAGRSACPRRISGSAIGGGDAAGPVINDVVDLPADAVTKPHKPLVRGVISPSSAAGAGVVLGAIGLGAAATINLATLGLDALALCAGLGYDLGLRRTPLSWVPWWGGMALLPFEGYASVGSIPSRLLALIPLSGLIAVGLHVANALPDIEGDRAAGRRSLPVLLGAGWSTWVGPGALAAAGLLATLLAGPLGQAGPGFIAGVVVLGAGVGAAVVTRTRRPFPILAVSTAVFAIAWLASLPRVPK
jgi:4-hydroxybenzoate polyprenyltransferase